MDNKLIKNMDYWKKKNDIPGIEALEKAGLTDGRAGSSPFQINLMGLMSGGMLGKGGWGKQLMQGNFKGAAQTALNPLSALGMGGQGQGGGLIGNGAGGGGIFNGGVDPMAQQALGQPVAATPMQTPMVMRSPMKQEEEEKRIYVGGAYEVGDLVSEDDFEEAFKNEGNDPNDYPQLSVQDYSEIKQDDNGMYVIRQEGGPTQVDPLGGVGE